ANSEQRTANSEQRTANSEQRTANSEQRTANSEQRTANSEQVSLSQSSWFVNVSDLDPSSFDLSVQNPHKPEEEDAPLSAENLLDALIKLEEESLTLLHTLRGSL
ncbi:MAG: hypothetical protein J6P19_09550, partial [Acetobacter sp.]|nr:hypothetical protein [Acetobacter sp.]